MDGMVSKTSCVEDITRPQWLQQVCHTQTAGVMAGTGTVGGEASCAWGPASTDEFITIHSLG